MDKKALRQKQMEDLKLEKLQAVKDMHINSTVIIDAVEGEIAIQDVRDDSVCRFPLEGLCFSGGGIGCLSPHC